MTRKRTIGVVLFPGFELLDVFGPLEMYGKFFTSSGVSAGIDMSLALIAKLHGEETAEKVAAFAEYEWHHDASWDPFAEMHGLV